MARLRTVYSPWCFTNFPTAGRLCTTTLRLRNKTASSYSLLAKGRSLLDPHLHSATFRQPPVRNFHLAIAYDPLEFLLGLDLRPRGRWRPRDTAARALIHGFICQAVGFLIMFPHRMADREPVELRHQFLGAPMQVLQHRILHFVNT